MNQTLKRWPFVVISYCAVTREIILFHIECSWWVQECSLGFMSKHNRTISFDKKFLTKLIKGPKLWSLPFIQLLLCDIFQLLWRNAAVSLSRTVISLEGCARVSSGVTDCSLATMTEVAFTAAAISVAMSDRRSCVRTIRPGRICIITCIYMYMYTEIKVAK